MKYEETIFLKQNNTEIEYGLIHGDNTIIFIKPGTGGNCYGYNNKYLKVAKILHENHGCSVIAGSNPFGYQNDMAMEINIIRDYAKAHGLKEYQVYYLGQSNGAAIGIINAYKYPEIKKLVCINSPLMINPHLLFDGIKKFNGEKMFLVYGSNDPSFPMIKIYSELESERIEFIHVNGADHNFTACLDLFIELPGVLFFGDELTYKGAKVR